MIIKCYNAYKMLSMVAITMLLVSKHFVYELPLFFFPANPHGELCILSRSPKKSACQVLMDKVSWGGLLHGRVHLPQTAACVYAAESPFWPHDTDTVMTSLSYPCPHGKFSVSLPSVLPPAVFPSVSTSLPRSTGPLRSAEEGSPINST